MLACFDKAARSLQSATQSRDVVVLDRAEVKRTRRSLFGFTLPSLALFGNGGSDKPGAAAREDDKDEIRELETTIRRSTEQAYGRYTLVLEEGGTWRTTEPWGRGNEPEPGIKVTIKHGALSRYTLRIPGGRPVGVERVN